MMIIGECLMLGVVVGAFLTTEYAEDTEFGGLGWGVFLTPEFRKEAKLGWGCWLGCGVSWGGGAAFLIGTWQRWGGEVSGGRYAEGFY